MGIGTPGALSPVRGGDRVVALDVVRGFAILGILLVNIEIFSQGLTFGGRPQSPAPDLFASALVQVFASGKFISTLAFLFGLGFTFQGMRAEARERSPTRLLVRRIAVLGLFGLAHAILIWSGDILLTYTLMALVLLLFRRQSPRTLLTWAGCILGAWVLILMVGVVFTALAGPEVAAEAGAAAIPAIDAFAEQARAAYTSGSYPQMVAQRLRELVSAAFAMFFVGWFVFPMMLAGAAVARAGWLADLEAHRPALRRAAVIGLGAGLPLNIAYAAFSAMDPGGVGPFALAGLACWSTGAPALSIGYMASVTLFTLSRPGSAIAARLAAVGRLALTNYLAQSIVMTAIFYGLGLYGRIGLVPSLGIAVAFLALQVYASPRYLARFSAGPAESLWRRLTYGSR